jgi:cytoskeletal protein CcmA (bactofilin family)
MTLRQAVTTFATCVSLFAVPAHALDIQRVQAYDLPATNSIAGQAIIVAESATVHGTSEDDLFLIAGNVTVAGTMLNDAWILANAAQVGGVVHDHLRVAANTAILTGTFSNSVAVAGNTVQIARECRVSGSANATGGSIVMEGIVDGPVRIMAERATLGGVVRGHARIIANDIVVLPGTVIEGDLVYTCPKELILDNRVELGGQIVRKEFEQASGEMPAISPMQIVVMQFYLLLAALMFGLPFAGIMPRLTGNAVRLISRHMLRCSFVGMLAFCLLPMVGVFALMTVIGIPLAIAVFALFGLALYTGKIVVAITLGGAIMRWHGPQSFSRVMLAMILGLVLLYSLAALPIVGLAMWFVVTFLGLGSLILGLFETQAGGPEPPAIPADKP